MTVETKNEVDPNATHDPALEADVGSVGLPPVADTNDVLAAATDKEAGEQPAETELEYTVYEDENANSAMSLLKESGVKATEAKEFFKEAITSRDPSKVDYAAIEKRIGKEKTSLLRLALNQYYNTTLASVTEKVNAVFEEVGSEANWKKVHDWAVAKSNADPEFKKQSIEYNKMFDLNTRTARAAAKELKDLYEADPKNKSLMVNMVQGDKPGSNEGESTQITRSEYLEKMKAAQAKNDVQEIERLRALRLASKQAGI